MTVCSIHKSVTADKAKCCKATMTNNSNTESQHSVKYEFPSSFIKTLQTGVFF